MAMIRLRSNYWSVFGLRGALFRHESEIELRAQSITIGNQSYTDFRSVQKLMTLVLE